MMKSLRWMMAAAALVLSVVVARGDTAAATGAEDRATSVAILTRIAGPVLEAAAGGQLHARLPSHDWEQDRAVYAHLEAFGRTLAGVAPWLELGPDDTPEGRLRAHYIDLAVRGLTHAVDPASPDFLNFNRHGGQPLVDAAFLAHALLRAPKQLWGNLTPEAQANLVEALKSTRTIKPYESNWLLFSAMIETALWHFTGDCNLQPIDYAVSRHEQWYLGDGTYGDGTELHWDYYNSYVIQPMLLAVMEECVAQKHYPQEKLALIRGRAQRYAVIQERLISPEGTFPVMGRSSAYRFGALQHLADTALRHELPPELAPGAVRSALTAVITRMADAPGTFDTDGWLQVGAVGHQPSIREGYISTGSLYLCLTGMVHLGLPADDLFWTAPAEPWTQKRIWSGVDVPRDHAYSDPKPRR